MKRLVMRILLCGSAALSLLGVVAQPWNDLSARPDKVDAAPAGLRVVGNQLVDTSGTLVVLRGVNRYGWNCAPGWYPDGGPHDASTIPALLAWHINAVRIPLNEDCWLGINGVSPASSGTAYQHAVAAYVSLLSGAGIYTILDLHWSAPATTLSGSQQPMADEDHAPAFWSSVAATFKDNPAVLFDLYNEPRVTPECELAGCTATSDQGVPYRTAGMQELVNTVRGAEAANVILIEGTHWGGDLTGWLANEPNDPAHNLAASWHTYNFASCNTPACWSAEIAALAARVPVITGEVGENDGGATYFNALLPWLDAHGISYLAWSWVTPGIDNVWALIADFQSGAPTAYGQAYHDHLASVVAEHRAPVVVPARPSPETTATATPAAVAPPRSRPPRTGLE